MTVEVKNKPIEQAKELIKRLIQSNSDPVAVYVQIMEIESSTNVDKKFLRSLYLIYLEQSLKTPGHSASALQETATNLEILRQMESSLPQAERFLTVQDQLILLRNALTQQINFGVTMVLKGINDFEVFDNDTFVLGMQQNIITLQQINESQASIAIYNGDLHKKFA